MASMVDTFLYLTLARTGDQLQGIKKGILEIADVLRSTRPMTTRPKHEPRPENSPEPFGSSTTATANGSRRCSPVPP